MRRSYQQILDKLKPVADENPERFMRFYDRVYLLLQAIKPGQTVLIEQCCTERSRELFVDVVELCIIESRLHDNPDDGQLCFSVDMKSIFRDEIFRSSERKTFFYKT